MRLFLILLLVLGALAGAVWDDLGQRATVRQQAGALTAYAQAGDADTVSANDDAKRCSREAAAGVRAGAAISRIAVKRSAAPSGQQPLEANADLQNVVGP